MTNKIAPYNNPELMDFFNKWWDSHSDSFRGKQCTMLDLFLGYQHYIEVSLEYLLTPNQFAKCLTKAKIADIGGGNWMRLDNWQPKEYEITRAKVY